MTVCIRSICLNFILLSSCNLVHDSIFPKLHNVVFDFLAHFFFFFIAFSIISFRPSFQDYFSKDEKEEEIQNFTHKAIFSQNESQGAQNSDIESRKRTTDYFLKHLDREISIPLVKLSPQTLKLLERFDVDPVRGFLPHDDPLQRLPQLEFQLWEDIVSELPSLIISGQIRNILETIPIVSINNLSTEPQRRRALLVLSMLCHAYVWGETQSPSDFLPEGIAVPLCNLANKMKLPPVMTHQSLILYNWRKLDKDGPLSVKNLSTLCQFLGGQDESWFYLSTVEIEAKGGAVMGILIEAQYISTCADSLMDTDLESRVELIDKLATCLRTIEKAVYGMQESLKNMHVGCDPKIFYQRVRPFLSGWKSNPTLPHGVLYNSANGNKRQQYYGGSAAQSSLFSAIDAALGIEHKSKISAPFLKDMRSYMPPKHQEFIGYLESPKTVTIHSFVDSLRTSNDLRPCASNAINAYNAAVKSVESFRTAHIGIVAAYIMQQQRVCYAKNEACSPVSIALNISMLFCSHIYVRYSKEGGDRSYTRENASGGKGTGGTELLDFLRPLRDDSCAVMIENESQM